MILKVIEYKDHYPSLLPSVSEYDNIQDSIYILDIQYCLLMDFP
jgi:hypothetical protein